MAGEEKKYFEPLDGFRGLAILFILLFHSRYTCFKILWIGVPMFFVLSGFLITRILLHTKNAHNYFKVFYTRRALRILPVYYLTLFMCVLWGLYSRANLSQLPLYFFYLQSFVISGDIPPEFCAGVLRHTWSLSVEELFYLFWPLVVYFSTRTFLFRFTLILGIGTFFFKLFWVLFFYQANHEPFLTLSLQGNADSLMAGGFLGIVSLGENSFLKRAFPFKLFLSIAIAFCAAAFFNYVPLLNLQFAYLAKVMLSSLAAVLSFLVVALFVVYSNINSPVYKTFTFKPLLFLGKISYGIYMYHNLVYRAVDSFVYQNKIQLPLFFIFLAQIMLTLIISLLSWYFMEASFLKLKEKVNYRFLS